MSHTLAEELGQFGLRPELLLDVLMGTRVELGTSEGPFWRVLGGQVSCPACSAALLMLQGPASAHDTGQVACCLAEHIHAC